jgi:hypothetical protein
MFDTTVPSNTYEVKNLANGDGFVYVGKSALVEQPGGNRTITEGSNCLATFMVGSIIPGRNIRLDIPTEKDPNVFLDAKFFDFQAYSPQITGSCALGRTVDSSGDMSYYFRAITNDGSATNDSWTIIEADDASFYIGYDGLTYYRQSDGTYSRSVVATNPNSLILKTHDLDMANTFPFMPSLYTHKTKDDYGNTTFYLNKLIAGPGLTIKDDGDTIRLDFDYTKARPTPCCDSNYSGYGIDDPVSVSSSSIDKITCSDFATMYIVGYDFKKNADLDVVTCEGGFCNWSKDIYTFSVITGAPQDFNSSSSSSNSSSSESSSSDSSSSQSELHGRATVEIKNLFTEDDPNAPFFPNGTYELVYTAHHFWETPEVPGNPNAPYISITYVETDAGWQWKANYGCGFRKTCGYGCSPSNCELSNTVYNKEDIWSYFSFPANTFSFNSETYKCGSPLFVRGMTVTYLNGGEFIWNGNSSSSSSSDSSDSTDSSSQSDSSTSSHSSQSNSSSSSSYIENVAPYYVRSGWYYRLKAEETTDGYFMWNLRVMKYETYYRDCLDDESSDYYRDYDRDFDQQERKVYRQDTQLLVLTLATSGAFDLFTRDEPLQPNGRFLYNEELTKDWVELTAPPAYAHDDPARLEFNVDELRLSGPHNNDNSNTFADITKAFTDCGPYVESSSSSMSDSETMGPMVSESSNSSSSSSSFSSRSSSSHSSWSSHSSESSSSSSDSSSSFSSYSGSDSSESSTSSSSSSSESSSSTSSMSTTSVVIVIESTSSSSSP